MFARAMVCVAALAALPCLAGCLPMEPQWLPDSSGLVYTKPAEDAPSELRHIDLENGRQRTVAAVATLGTSPPGVSPHSDRIAVLESFAAGEQRGVKVRVYDLAGELVHTSPPILTTDSTGGDGVWDAVSWSPIGDQLFLWIDPPTLYDLQSRKIEQAEAGVSPCLAFLFYRLSPFVPDGSGVLVQRQHGERPAELLLWSAGGKLTPIKMDASAERAMHNEKAESGPQEGWPMPGRWEKGVARIPIETGYAIIDPARGTMRHEADAEMAELFARVKRGQWASVAPFSQGDRRVVVRRLTNYTGNDPDPKFTIELFVGDRATQVIAKEVHSGYTSDVKHVPLYPSPDGRYMAIKYRRLESEAPRLMIVDERGKIRRDDEL